MTVGKGEGGGVDERGREEVWMTVGKREGGGVDDSGKKGGRSCG